MNANGVLYAAHTGGPHGVPPRQGEWEMTPWATENPWKRRFGDGGMHPPPRLAVGTPEMAMVPPMVAAMPMGGGMAAAQPREVLQMGMVVEAVPVVAQALPMEAVPMGAGSGGSGGPTTLMEITNVLKAQLGLSGTMAEVVAAACAELGVETKGKSLMEQARAAHAMLT